MRHAAAADSNQPDVVKALRKVGASVQHLHTLGRGVPDILVGYRGRNTLIEIKDGKAAPSKRKLTSDEQYWHRVWRGQVAVCESPEEALRAIGAIGPHPKPCGVCGADVCLRGEETFSMTTPQGLRGRRMP